MTASGRRRRRLQGLPRVTCAVATSTSGDTRRAVHGAREDGRQPASPPPLRFFTFRSADASPRLRACSAFCAGESPERVAFSRSRCSRLSRRRSFAACLSAKESSSSCVSRTLRNERHQNARCSYRFAALDTCNRTPRLPSLELRYVQTWSNARGRNEYDQRSRVTRESRQRDAPAAAKGCRRFLIGRDSTAIFEWITPRACALRAPGRRVGDPLRRTARRRSRSNSWNGIRQPTWSPERRSKWRRRLRQARGLRPAEKAAMAFARTSELASSSSWA